MSVGNTFGSIEDPAKLDCLLCVLCLDTSPSSDLKDLLKQVKSSFSCKYESSVKCELWNKLTVTIVKILQALSHIYKRCNTAQLLIPLRFLMQDMNSRYE